jgi:predicted DNA-binding transcriptional regulator AlpA
MDTKYTPIDSRNFAASPVDAAPSILDELLVAAATAARVLGISRAQLWKLHSAGKIPAPVYLGTKAPRWRVAELQAWTAAGCPPRDQWERLRLGGSRR